MRTYKAGWALYLKFATQFHIAPQPITVEKVTLFIAHVGAQRLSATTIEVYLAGLRFFRLLADPSCAAPSFHTPYTNLLIRGIKQVNAGKGTPRVQLPITTAVMLRIKKALASDPHSFENRLLWAACCTGFFVVVSSCHQTQGQLTLRCTYVCQMSLMFTTKSTIT